MIWGYHHLRKHPDVFHHRFITTLFWKYVWEVFYSKSIFVDKNLFTPWDLWSLIYPIHSMFDIFTYTFSWFLSGQYRLIYQSPCILWVGACRVGFFLGVSYCSSHFAGNDFESAKVVTTKLHHKKSKTCWLMFGLFWRYQIFTDTLTLYIVWDFLNKSYLRIPFWKPRVQVQRPITGSTWVQ